MMTQSYVIDDSANMWGF